MSEQQPETTEPGREPDGTLTSKEMAGLIVDALIDAGFISEDRFGEATAIAAEEITARKVLGDY